MSENLLQIHLDLPKSPDKEDSFDIQILKDNEGYWLINHVQQLKVKLDRPEIAKHFDQYLKSLIIIQLQLAIDTYKERLG